MRVLLVDDNAELADNLAELLASDQTSACRLWAAWS